MAPALGAREGFEHGVAQAALEPVVFDDDDASARGLRRLLQGLRSIGFTE